MIKKLVISPLWRETISQKEWAQPFGDSSAWFLQKGQQLLAVLLRASAPAHAGEVMQTRVHVVQLWFLCYLGQGFNPMTSVYLM